MSQRDSINATVFANFPSDTVEVGEPVVSEPDANGVRQITYPFTIKPTKDLPPLEFSITATDPPATVTMDAETFERLRSAKEAE